MYRSARRSSGPGDAGARQVAPPVRPSEVGSFSAVETVWKFIPKMAGTPACFVPLWSRPSISLRIAVTLNESYSIVAALSEVQSSPAGKPIASHLTKGSGSNGVDTVYFVDTTGKACPNGVGVPQPGAALPDSPLSFDPTQLQKSGLPSNMCVLSGFPTTLAKSSSSTAFPFGIWFANPTTLYVADEGNGSATFSTATGTFTDNAATGLPWSPAIDGLRIITGRVNRDGTATIWAVTSTVSGSGDQGADPNQLVSITDRLGATSSGNERFETVAPSRYGQVVRGVSLAPNSAHHARMAGRVAAGLWPDAQAVR